MYEVNHYMYLCIHASIIQSYRNIHKKIHYDKIILIAYSKMAKKFNYICIYKALLQNIELSINTYFSINCIYLRKLILITLNQYLHIND